MMRNETIFILKIFPLTFSLFPLTFSIKTLPNHHNALNHILDPKNLHSTKGCDIFIVKYVVLETKH